MKYKAAQDVYDGSQKRDENPTHRSKIPLRTQYMLEKERIQSEIGDLEQIRLTLGLSQRRMCQLLLVDPSAWTRWNKTGAPPHIYQALKWLLALNKSNPEVTAPNNIATRVDYLQTSTQSKIAEIKEQIVALERAITLTPAPAAYPTTDIFAAKDLAFEHSLRNQEERLQTEITKLKEVIEQLVAEKRVDSRAKKIMRAPLPPAKARKKHKRIQRKLVPKRPKSKMASSHKRPTKSLRRANKTKLRARKK